MGKQFYLLPWEETLLDKYYLRKKNLPRFSDLNSSKKRLAFAVDVISF